MTRRKAPEFAPFRHTLDTVRRTGAVAGGVFALDDPSGEVSDRADQQLREALAQAAGVWLNSAYVSASSLAKMYSDAEAAAPDAACGAASPSAGTEELAMVSARARARGGGGQPSPAEFREFKRALEILRRTAAAGGMGVFGGAGASGGGGANGFDPEFLYKLRSMEELGRQGYVPPDVLAEMYAEEPSAAPAGDAPGAAADEGATAAEEPPAAVEEAPPEQPPAPAELDAVAEELQLRADLKAEDLNRIRRQFALRNHPDRVPPSWREWATRRMTIANTLIDQALRERGGGDRS